ncbi:hypothetical protein PVAND_009716 [Polypedilum vanderplanki]|uniref:Zinc finger CCHC domain-containing protein 7 n=1 Tax=Polypedilum vanderplanki TaxID=319348 RepID=A0A9J6CE22_POLVA|nr:hypothetical protein PVAND_009716 [Polypedilum vanderplanki]
MESDDLENLEEELYSKIYHDSNPQNTIEGNVDLIIENSTLRKSAGSSLRYYQENINKNSNKPKQSQTQRFIKPRKFQDSTTTKNSQSNSLENKNSKNDEQEKTIQTKSFVPYTSVLFSSVLRNETENSEIDTLKNIVVLDDQESQTIVIKDQESSESKDVIVKDDKIFMSPCKKIMKLSKQKAKTKKQLKIEPELIEILSSDDDGSVIFVENPVPPLIAVESSSDEDGIKEKKRNNKKGSGSPSTSSIISDEFIVRSDKSRLKNIFCKKNLNIVSQSNSQAHQIYDEDTSNDSIYNTKLMTMNRFQGSLKPISLSNKTRQRSSSDEEENVGARIIDANSLKSQEKRLRYEKNNYNETEFTSLISTALVQKSTNVEKKERKSDRRKSTSSKSDIVVDEEQNDAIQNCDLILNVSSENNTNNDTNDECNFIVDLSGDINVSGVDESVNSSVDQIDCEVGWNEEMKYFYNEYSYGRDFSLTNIRNFMPFDNWKIVSADRNLVTDNNGKKLRCHNCNEIGHKSFQCYRPKKQNICFMCGEIGHNEMRCPKALCLRCGKATMRFSTVCSNCVRFGKKRCPLCKNSFHDLDQCPDKWRRYFATTTENNEVLNIECKQNVRVYCSVCAKKGHFADSCIYFNRQKDGYITSSWFVVSNKPSYTSSSKFEIKVQNEHIFQLLSYMDVYYFNFKLPSNCQFYPRFRQRYLEEKCGIRMIEEKKEHQKEDIEEVSTNILQENIPKQSTESNDELSLSEAKILLNVNHKKIIKSEKKHIETLGSKFNVALKFPEFADQNYLFILGTVINQNKFQKELREFFFKCELVKHEEKIETSTQLPKTISKITERVKSDLQSIKCIGIREAKKTLQSFIQSEVNLDYKNLVKFRRNLNIVFMGYGELKEGAFHLRELRKILVTLEKHIEEGNGNNHLDQKLKEKLASHLKYIFSPIDHGNYLQLFRNYKQVVMQKKSKKKDVKNN